MSTLSTHDHLFITILPLTIVASWPHKPTIQPHKPSIQCGTAEAYIEILSHIVFQYSWSKIQDGEESWITDLRILDPLYWSSIWPPYFNMAPSESKNLGSWIRHIEIQGGSIIQYGPLPCVYLRYQETKETNGYFSQRIRTNVIFDYSSLHSHICWVTEIEVSEWVSYWYFVNSIEIIIVKNLELSLAIVLYIIFDVFLICELWYDCYRRLNTTWSCLFLFHI